MKRATDYKKMTKKEDWISIHALVKRATTAYKHILLSVVLFQSTPS